MLRGATVLKGTASLDVSGGRSRYIVEHKHGVEASFNTTALETTMATAGSAAGIKALTFWQAFRVLLLASILFGGGTRVIERGHEVVTADTIENAAN